MKPVNTIQLLNNARSLAQQGQFMPAINMLMQVIDAQDTLELREELLELLQKVNNLKACAEQCVIIGYRLMSKNDIEGAIKSFARGLKFYPKEYEALEKLVEVCTDYPEVPKKFKFKLDEFVLESFKIHVGNNDYEVVDQSYSSIADLLSKKSPVHKLVSKLFEKKNLPNLSESRRLETLARVYSLQKKIGKAKKIYKTMTQLDENMNRRSGLLKSVQFLQDQQKRKRKRVLLFVKILVVVGVVFFGSGSYFFYHQKASKSYEEVQKKAKIELEQLKRKLPSKIVLKKLTESNSLEEIAVYLKALFEQKSIVPLKEQYEKEILEKYPYTLAALSAKNELKAFDTLREKIELDCAQEISWFQIELKKQFNQSNSLFEKKEFEKSLALLASLQEILHGIEKPDLVQLEEEVATKIEQMEREQEQYQKRLAKKEQERQERLAELKKFVAEAENLISQGLYEEAFKKYYRPLIEDSRFEDFAELKQLKVPFLLNVPQIPVDLYKEDGELLNNFWEKNEKGILLKLPVSILSQSLKLVLKCPGFEDLPLEISLSQFPKSTPLFLKRIPRFQFKASKVIGTFVQSKNNLFFNGENGKFYGLDLSQNISESSPWFIQKKMPYRVTLAGSPAIQEDKALIVAKEKSFFLLDWRRVSIRKFKASKGISTGAISLGKKGFLFGDNGGKIQSFQCREDKVFGKTKANLLGALTAPPLYVSKKKRIYCGTSKGYFYALKRKKGFPVDWKVKTGMVTTTPVATENSIFLTLSDKIIALDLKGKKIWEYPKEGKLVAPVSQALFAAGMLFVADGEGSLHCFDAKTKTLKWVSKKFGKFGLSGPVLFQKKVYFGTDKGMLYALSLETGDMLWSYPTESSIVAINIVERKNSYAFKHSLLFVGAANSYILVFEIP